MPLCCTQVRKKAPNYDFQGLCKCRAVDEALQIALDKQSRMREFQHLCKVNEAKILHEAAQQREEELVFITAVLEKERHEDAEEEAAKELSRQKHIAQREQLLEELREAKEDEQELDRLIPLEN